jgi:hypothetical protein
MKKNPVMLLRGMNIHCLLKEVWEAQIYFVVKL